MTRDEAASRRGSPHDSNGEEETLQPRAVHRGSGRCLQSEGIAGGEVAPEALARTTFSDRGTGIPASILQRVSEPFFTTKPGSSGTGLGLGISSHIVHKHRERLMVQSVEGSWTRVLINLPVGVEEDVHG